VLPSAFDLLPGLAEARRVTAFLDFDGTLAPIVRRPELARLDPAARTAVARLAEVATVAIVSGRHLDDLIARVNLRGIAYGGSHGLEVQRRDGRRTKHGHPETYDDEVRRAADLLIEHAADHPGTQVERKPFSVAIHYPHSEPQQEAHFRSGVRALGARFERLEVLAGKHVLEFRPRSGWNKGDVVKLLLQEEARDTLAIVLGDDVTDEDAFRAVEPEGHAIHVGAEPAWRSSAQFRLESPAEVRDWITRLAATLEARPQTPKTLARDVDPTPARLS
jgi:trehalose-phosphatase